VPEEEDVEDDGEEQCEGADDPDDEGEQHSEVDDGLLLVASLDERVNVHEELLERGSVVCSSVIADGNELGLHDSPKRHGIDSSSRALRDDEEEGT
jgi:hypothetical protein